MVPERVFAVALALAFREQQRRLCVAGVARSVEGEPLLGPLLRGGRTVPEDARALEVCDEC
jgi:hypothetical protein